MELTSVADLTNELKRHQSWEDKRACPGAAGILPDVTGCTEVHNVFQLQQMVGNKICPGARLVQSIVNVLVTLTMCIGRLPNLHGVIA